ncbi:MAG: hypothetical protein SVZ03_12040 [Spirochaetota bacterium]|nr:hypothetical protein [Spirochaetota bacterium]
MNILNNIFIIVFVTIGFISGFLSILFIYAYYNIYRSEKITKELAKNRCDTFLHRSLHLKSH